MPIFHLAGLATEDTNKLQGKLPSTTSAPAVVVVTGEDGKISETFFPAGIGGIGYVAENIVNKGLANGYASLDGEGKVPLTQLPDLGSKAVIVDDIDARDAITPLEEGIRAFVLDASADPTVNAGAAEYIYHNDVWVKILEIESMDIAISTIPGLSDALASKSPTDHTHTELHTHTNKADVLDLFAVEEGTGTLLFDGSPIEGGGGGTPPGPATPSLITLSTSACTTYTNDTWTTLYTNGTADIQAMYLTSLTNRIDTEAIVSLRLVNNSDVELHTIIDNTTLGAYEGLENGYSQYPVPVGAKVQFKASASDCEAVICTGILPNAFQVATLNTYEDKEWTDLVDNSAGTKSYKLALISISNTASNDNNADLRITNSDATTVLYHLLPPITLTGRTGVENHIGYFVVGAGQKLQAFATISGMQFLVCLLENEPAS